MWYSTPVTALKLVSWHHCRSFSQRTKTIWYEDKQKNVFEKLKRVLQILEFQKRKQLDTSESQHSITEPPFCLISMCNRSKFMCLCGHINIVRSELFESTSFADKIILDSSAKLYWSEEICYKSVRIKKTETKWVLLPRAGRTYDVAKAF